MKKIAGLILLIGVVLVFAVLALLNRGRGGNTGSSGSAADGTGAVAITLKGFVGGEKVNFLQDTEVVGILRTKYGITLDTDKRGSLEMVQEGQQGERDFLWPSNQIALEIYKEKHPAVNAEILFNSPIVLYSWDNVTEALIKAKVVEKRNDSYFVVDFPKLVQMMNANTSWKSLGLNQLHGNVLIYSTDPTKSSSGNLFAGLLADTLNKGNVVNDQSVQAVLPTVKQVFDNQGYMEQNSDTIFKQFLNKGVGDKPIIVGYEAQLIEFSLENPTAMTSRQNAVRTLYPQPTVWSSHPLIALTDNGKKLITALQDKDIQRLAWIKHGFRSASGGDNDPKALHIVGIPATIENVVSMPAPRVMDKIIQSLR